MMSLSRRSKTSCFTTASGMRQKKSRVYAIETHVTCANNTKNKGRRRMLQQRILSRQCHTLFTYIQRTEMIVFGGIEREYLESGELR